MRPIDISQSTKPSGAFDPGAAPMLQWIPIADLVVDDEYQRELGKDNWTRIRRIAEHFRWSRFSTVFVSPIAGGKFAIIDGQHRTHAAALRGLESVPCQVVQMTREEQAASFAAVNGLVTKVTGWNILKAAIVAGETWAVECAAACRDAGCVLMTRAGSTEDKKPGEIYSVGLIRKAVEQGHRKSVTYVLDGIRRAPAAFSGRYRSYSVDALKPILLGVIERPHLLAERRDLAAFFGSFNVWKAIDAAEEQAKAQRRAGSTAVSRFDLAAAAIGEALDDWGQQQPAEPSRDDDEADLAALVDDDLGDDNSDDDEAEDRAAAVPIAPAPAQPAVTSRASTLARVSAAIDSGLPRQQLPMPAAGQRYRLRSLAGEYLHESTQVLTRMSRFYWRGTEAQANAVKRRNPKWKSLSMEPCT